MDQRKKFFISGATGNQGGAVARQLVARGHQVLALTRNPSSANALSLKSKGAELVEGDLLKPDSYRASMRGVDGVFGVQAFNKNSKLEILQGTTLIDVAVESEVKHFLYTSVGNADGNTDIPHFESKATIEAYLKKSGLPFTVIRPASFCENLLNPQVKNGILKGKLVMPLNKETVQQYIGMDDIGIVCGQIFENTTKYDGQTISLASDQASMTELAEIFASVLNIEVKYQKLPALVTRLVMGRKLARMFRWVDANDFKPVESITDLKLEFHGMGNLKSWIEKNFRTDIEV